MVKHAALDILDILTNLKTTKWVIYSNALIHAHSYMLIYTKMHALLT